MELIKFKIINATEIELANKDKRKTKKLRADLKSAIANIETIIELNEATVNAYFWSENGNAYNRKRRESELSFETSYSFSFVNFQLEQEARLSRRNVYIYKTYIINKEETNLRRVKTLLEEMNAVLNIFEEPKKFGAYLTKRERAEIKKMAWKLSWKRSKERAISLNKLSKEKEREMKWVLKNI